jgi:hypothetical protein
MLLRFYVFMAVVDQLFFFRVSAQFSRWAFFVLCFKGMYCLHVQGDMFLWVLKWLGTEPSSYFLLDCWPAKLCLVLSPVRIHDHILVTRSFLLNLYLVVLILLPHANPQKKLTLLSECLARLIQTYICTHGPMHVIFYLLSLLMWTRSHIRTLIYCTVHKKKTIIWMWNACSWFMLVFMYSQHMQQFFG